MHKKTQYILVRQTATNLWDTTIKICTQASSHKDQEGGVKKPSKGHLFLCSTHNNKPHQNKVVGKVQAEEAGLLLHENK